MFGKNWKTSLGGLGAILAALADISHGLAAGVPINWQADITGLIAGAGLLFAKDGNVTGGTKMQASSPEVLAEKSIENKNAGVPQ